MSDARLDVTPPAPGDVVLEAIGVSRSFRRRRWILSPAKRVSTFRAVDQVSLALHAGEVLGIVGASGSGKSTLARMLVRLTVPSSGTIRLHGKDIWALDPSAVRLEVRPSVRMIFQDPDAMLNPAYPVGEALRRAIRIGGVTEGSTIERRLQALLASVGLGDDHASKYPDELSGGEKRRLGICRALSSNPAAIVADEPLSGLDVLLQEQVLALLLRAQRTHNFGLILVSHDLDRVHQVCDRVMVMFAGRVVETVHLQRDRLARNVQYRHPYSATLVAANEWTMGTVLPAQFGSARSIETGCVYRNACARHSELQQPSQCAHDIPPLVPNPEHDEVACFFTQPTSTCL